jgi:type IV fimbrial biogenesis protein FimT
MRDRGFTLAELLVAMAIGALLVGLAAPGFARQRGEAAVRTAANQVLAALQLARGLALARGQSVTVCPSVDGSTCGFGGTQWLLFANGPTGTDSRREPGDELLQQWGLPGGVVVDGTRGYAAYQPRAGAAITVTFDFCHRATPLALSLVVSQNGRPRMERAAAARCTS